MKQYYEFKPYNVGRWIVWGLFALILLLAPKVFTSSLSVTMLSQMGIAIIACLSYNMLLGQGGIAALYERGRAGGIVFTASVADITASAPS